MKHILYILIAFATFERAEAQKTSSWTVLFDGVSIQQLRGYKMDRVPSDACKLENGSLVAQTNVPNIDLVTKDDYTNFDLTLDWAVSKGGNSGIFYHVQENSSHESGNGNSPNWLDNFEFQLHRNGASTIAATAAVV